MLSGRTVSRLVQRIPRARITSPITRSITTRTQPCIKSIICTTSITPQFVSRSSTSRYLSTKKSQTDEELAAKLESEIALEKDMVQYQEMPDSVKTFLESGGFKVTDNSGQEEVELVKNLGNETIRVEFSISDLNMVGQDSVDENESLYDEEEGEDVQESSQSHDSRSKSGKEQNRAQVNESEEDEEEEDDEFADESASGFPAHLNITIEKNTGGALKISAVAQDGMIVIQNVVHHTNPEIFKGKSAEANWVTEGLYSGPTFSHLDDDLQVLFEKYLEDRGINTALALFVPDYIEYKEQKEYLRWLQNVKKFVQA